jgi:hypothetical protein
LPRTPSATRNALRRSDGELWRAEGMLKTIDEAELLLKDLKKTLKK